MRKDFLRGGRTYEDVIREHKNWVDNIRDALRIHALLRAQLDAVSESKSFAVSIASGALLKEETGSINPSLDGFWADPRLVMEVLNNDELQPSTAEYIERLAANRLYVKELIAIHDASIQDAFSKAERAAKTNRILSLVQLGDQAFSKYWEGKTRKEDLMLLDSRLIEIAAQLEASPRREPAHKKLSNVFRAFAILRKNFDTVENVTKQMQKMEAERNRISATLPLGTSRLYDAVIQGNQFIGFTPANEPSVFSRGTIRSRYQEEIVGKNPRN